MRTIPALAFLALAAPAAALAQLPEPLELSLYPFPGAMHHPPSAVSAGVALADLWLGDAPFHNPAIARSKRVEVTPAFLRTSRQDLRSQTRNFDEQPGTFDAAGGAISMPLGVATLALYGYQPVLRLEDNAFARGEVGGPDAPAVIQSTMSAREWRAGLAVAGEFSAARIGVAAEWTQRSDDYEYHEQSGSPQAGDKRASFSGGGVGFQAGVRLRTPELWGGPLSVGVAGRFVPEITVDGEQNLATRARDTTFAISATRKAGLEGGLSIGYSPKRALGVVAGIGFKTEREWRGFGVASGAGYLWSLGLEYHDAEEPWTVRAGYGQERNADDPESRAGNLGLGFSWAWEGWSADVGVLHRSFEREPHPTSVDDRVLVSLRFDL